MRLSLEQLHRRFRAVMFVSLKWDRRFLCSFASRFIWGMLDGERETGYRPPAVTAPNATDQVSVLKGVRPPSASLIGSAETAACFVLCWIPRADGGSCRGSVATDLALRFIPWSRLHEQSCTADVPPKPLAP